MASQDSQAPIFSSPKPFTFGNGTSFSDKESRVDTVPKFQFGQEQPLTGLGTSHNEISINIFDENNFLT